MSAELIYVVATLTLFTLLIAIGLDWDEAVAYLMAYLAVLYIVALLMSLLPGWAGLA